MELPGLEGSAGLPEKKRRGRPKGATGKRSTDLVRYIEAFYGGLTPGQQAAAIGMVTPAELRRAARTARKVKLEPVVLAMAVKAKELAGFLGCTTAEAWEMMRKERAELMPYVHQKRPLQVDGTGGTMLPVIWLGASAPGGEVLDCEHKLLEENQGLNLMRPVEVSHLKSHGEDKAE